MARPKNKRPVSVAITFSTYDGKWHGYITVGAKADGTPDVRHRSAATEEACADKIRKLEDERAAGRIIKAGLSPTVEEYLTDWLAAGTNEGRWRYGTIRSYTTAVEQYLVPHLRGYRLDRLTKDHVKQMIAAVAERVSVQAAAKAHRVLRTALSEAVRDELVPRNVARLVQEPSIDEEEVEPLGVDEARRVLDVASRRRNAARWVIALSLGFRQGEALALAWRRPDKPRLPGDIDLDGGTITVREKLLRKTWQHGCADPRACGGAPRPKRPHGHHRLKRCRQPCNRHKRECPPPCPADCTDHASACPMRVGGGLVMEAPKSRAGLRPAAMPVPLVEALRVRRVEQDADRGAALDQWVETGLVFTTVWGAPLDPRADYDEWQSILREAGVPPARLHDARHSAATFLLIQGVSERVVMDLMGWSQASMVRRYQHVVDQLRREAARRVESLLWPVEAPREEDLLGRLRVVLGPLLGDRAEEFIAAGLAAIDPRPAVVVPAPRDTSTDHATGDGAKILRFRPKAV